MFSGKVFESFLAHGLNKRLRVERRQGWLTELLDNGFGVPPIRKLHEDNGTALVAMHIKEVIAILHRLLQEVGNQKVKSRPGIDNHANEEVGDSAAFVRIDFPGISMASGKVDIGIGVGDLACDLGDVSHDAIYLIFLGMRAKKIIQRFDGNLTGGIGYLVIVKRIHLLHQEDGSLQASLGLGGDVLESIDLGENDGAFVCPLLS